MSSSASPTTHPAVSGHPTTFLLIRHAESEANAGGYFGSQSDSPLTEKGQAQARALAHATAGLTIDVVLSSDLRRARDTVAPLAEARGLAVRTTPVLRERSMGLLTGQSFAHVAQVHPELWLAMQRRDPYVRPPEGESIVDLTARVAPLCEELLELHRGCVVVLGAHGGTIQVLLRYLLGVRDPQVPLWFIVGNASVSRVDVVYGPDGSPHARLVYSNRHAPDEERAVFHS